MKRKYLIIRFIFATLIIILGIGTLIGVFDNNIVMPYWFICLGVFQIFSGVDFYKRDKKSSGILLILFSIFILGVGIKLAIFL